MSDLSAVSLKTGQEMPLIGYGTGGLDGRTLVNSLQVALDKGYSHIDTAEGYRNEAVIGKVLENYERKELFLTSKVLPSNLHYDDVLESCEKSLEKLGTDYLDLYLIHWPNPAISVRETLHAFKKLYEEGLVKNIGVSNFNVYQLKVAQRVSGVPVAVNQVEFHPWHQASRLVDYCQNNGVIITASVPLARSSALKDPVINELADKYNKTSAQVILRWQVQRNIATIPGATTKKHIENNFEAIDFELNSTDVERINSIPREKKIYQLDPEDEVYGIPS